MKFVTLNQVAPFIEDFSFLNPKEKDTLVICNPPGAICFAPCYLKSRKSLEEHVEYVNREHIRKALIVAEDIRFLPQCPGLEHLQIQPALSAESFDYSPLYDMPNIRWLSCETVFGETKSIAQVDYSRIHGLKCLTVSGRLGNLNVEKVKGLKTLYLYDRQPVGDTLQGAFDGTNMEKLSVTTSGVRSLDGIEQCPRLRILELDHNYKLTNISGLEAVKDSLISLEIDTCNQIQDFSVLSKMHKLQRLYLRGKNRIPSLSFLKEMPSLKSLTIYIHVEDGDLRPCKTIPFVNIANHRHYNFKDEDFSHAIVRISELDEYAEW